MNRLNQQRLIDLRLARGVPVRQVARDCGIEIAVLNRLETCADPSVSNVYLGAMLRVADYLAVPIGDLFTDDLASPIFSADAPPTPGNGGGTGTDNDVDATVVADDAATLGALITALGKSTATLVLADALGWTIARVHTAAAQLDTTLRTVGMTVYRDSGFLSIRPIDNRTDTAEIAARRHPRARLTQRLLTPARARILYRASLTPISPHSISNSDRSHVATLYRAGSLVEDEKRHFIPSPDVDNSINLDAHT